MKAEKWFKSATTNEEKILALEEMLRVMPKHKGTDHLKADLRRKLSKLKEAPAKKGGGKHVDIFHIPKTGAGQIALIGMPNSGKSSILAALTNGKVNVADFPFATNAPVPGMAQFEDVQIELVDMPPITEEFVMPGQVGTYRHCDLIGIVIDLSEDVVQQADVILDFLESRNLIISDKTEEVDDNGNILGRKAFCICTKSDIAKEKTVERIEERLKGYNFDYIVCSTETFEGIESLPKKLFELLDIIRIYSNPPGKEADMTDPFTLPAGSTVMDLAKAIHRQLAENLKSARIWGTGVHPGQNVQKTHILNDKDIIELHFG